MLLGSVYHSLGWHLDSHSTTSAVAMKVARCLCLSTASLCKHFMFPFIFIESTALEGRAGQELYPVSKSAPSGLLASCEQRRPNETTK